ncbi:alpha 1,2-mannosyltransferase 2.4.1 [Ceratobasidium sp. 414]|nr:alpha 1,2-mannosyltransferase 2.4.1 [Ceratobasidium sp. 414]
MLNQIPSPQQARCSAADLRSPVPVSVALTLVRLMAKFSSPAFYALSSPRRYIPLTIFVLFIVHYFLGLAHEGYSEATSLSRLADSWRKVAETTCNSTAFLPPPAPPTASSAAYYLPAQPSPFPPKPRPIIEVENFSTPTRKANAAFVFLARNSDLAGVMQSMKHMEDRFNKKFNYPYVFLNDVPFDKRFKYHTSQLTNANVSYGVIESSHWNQPDWIDEEYAAANRKWMKDNNIIYGDSVPYRNMCRFNSGFFYRHELLKQYDYYWRIEPDVTFFCDLDDDPFLFMQDNKKVYGFTIALYEFPETIMTLWNATREFIQKYPELVPEDNAMAFLSDDGGESYNNCHFWSNFEIGDLNFWRSEAYSKYFDFLDSKGGFYYERWGDAPVHSIGAALFAKKDQIHFFENIGYRHNPFEHCPTGRLHTQNKCWCDEARTFDNPDLDPYSSTRARCFVSVRYLWLGIPASCIVYSLHCNRLVFPTLNRPVSKCGSTVTFSIVAFSKMAQHRYMRACRAELELSFDVLTLSPAPQLYNMSPTTEKSGQSPARTSNSRSNWNKFLAATLLTSAALYCCRSKVTNAIEDVLLTPFAPKPEDYCKQVDAFDASNWTAAYDVDGFEEKAAEWLGGAVRIPTESFDSMGPVGDDDHWLIFDKFHKYLEEQFPGVHKTLKLEKVNTYGLLYTWPGSDPSLKPLLLMGHQAFGFDEEVSGPRTTDPKEQGAQPLSKRIIEIYGEDGVAMIVDEGDTAGSVAMDKGVAIARPAVGEKGYMDVAIEVQTPGGHSSVPPEHTSIGLLSRIIVDFENHPHEVRLHRTNPMYTLLQCEAAFTPPSAMLPRFRKAIQRSIISDAALEFVNEVMSRNRVWRAFVGTTQAADIIQGGVKANALPEQAKVLINHRIAIESSVVELQKHVVQRLRHWGACFNLSVEAFGHDVSKREGPFYGSINATIGGHDALDVAPLSPTDLDSKPWVVLSSSIRGAYRDSKREKVAEGDIIVAPALMSGNTAPTDTKFYWKTTKHIFRYNHHFAGDLYNGAHTANEAYKVKGFVDMIKFFTTLIVNADRPDAL